MDGPLKKPANKAGIVTGPGHLVKQPHGGAIHQGAPGRIVPGQGRPRNQVREKLLAILDDRVDLIAKIADGEPIVKTKIALSEVLKHARCPRCDGELDAIDPEAFVMIESTVSASPRDRTAALAMAAQFGLGPAKEPGIPADLDAFARAVQEHVGPEQWALIEPEWVALVVRRLKVE